MTASITLDQPTDAILGQGEALAEMLKRLGYTDIRTYHGGIKDETSPITMGSVAFLVIGRNQGASGPLWPLENAVGSRSHAFLARPERTAIGACRLVESCLHYEPYRAGSKWRGSPIDNDICHAELTTTLTTGHLGASIPSRKGPEGEDHVPTGTEEARTPKAFSSVPQTMFHEEV